MQQWILFAADSYSSVIASLGDQLGCVEASPWWLGKALDYGSGSALVECFFQKNNFKKQSISVERI